MVELSNKLEELNRLPLAEASDELLKCCGSREFVKRLCQQRPFQSIDDLKRQAELIWWSLSIADWLEAFRSHPKIGEQKGANPVAVKSQQWSQQEQSGVVDSGAQTLQQLAELNREYEKKFGYIYIVCATGKSAAEMLSILRDRLQNTADDELRVAAAEQAKITELRINKLLNQ